MQHILQADGMPASVSSLATVHKSSRDGLRHSTLSVESRSYSRCTNLTIDEGVSTIAEDEDIAILTWRTQAIAVKSNADVTLLPKELIIKAGNRASTSRQSSSTVDHSSNDESRDVHVRASDMPNAGLLSHFEGYRISMTGGENMGKGHNRGNSTVEDRQQGRARRDSKTPSLGGSSGRTGSHDSCVTPAALQEDTCFAGTKPFSSSASRGEDVAHRATGASTGSYFPMVDSVRKTASSKETNELGMSYPMWCETTKPLAIAKQAKMSYWSDDSESEVEDDECESDDEGEDEDLCNPEGAEDGDVLCSLMCAEGDEYEWGAVTDDISHNNDTVQNDNNYSMTSSAGTYKQQARSSLLAVESFVTETHFLRSHITRQAPAGNDAHAYRPLSALRQHQSQRYTGSFASAVTPWETDEMRAKEVPCTKPKRANTLPHSILRPFGLGKQRARSPTAPDGLLNDVQLAVSAIVGPSRRGSLSRRAFFGRRDTGPSAQPPQRSASTVHAAREEKGLPRPYDFI